MSETVSAAVEQVNGGAKMIAEQAWESILPAHVGAARFQRWALHLLQRPEIAVVARTDAGRLSIMSALLDAASLGLEPGREYHLVPYGAKVTGIIDYKGEIRLITNANPDTSVCAMLVRKGDDFAMVGANVPPHHEADWFNDENRGEVTGGYAYADFGGQRYSQVIRMSEAQFLKHRAKAQTVRVWDEWPDAMRLKTLVHQLRKWVPWSAEKTEGR